MIVWVQFLLQLSRFLSLVNKTEHSTVFSAKTKISRRCCSRRFQQVGVNVLVLVAILVGACVLTLISAARVGVANKNGGKPESFSNTVCLLYALLLHHNALLLHHHKLCYTIYSHSKSNKSSCIIIVTAFIALGILSFNQTLATVSIVPLQVLIQICPCHTWTHLTK